MTQLHTTTYIQLHTTTTRISDHHPDPPGTRRARAAGNYSEQYREILDGLFHSVADTAIVS